MIGGRLFSPGPDRGDEALERPRDRSLVPGAAALLERGTLLLPETPTGTLKTSLTGCSLGCMDVHADDRLLAGLDPPLQRESGLVDLGRDQPRLDRGNRAAGLDDLEQARDDLELEGVGERLDVVRAAERIGDARRARLVGGDLLCP